MRLKLQLFAQKLNKNTSIVDYLKSEGEDSSYSAREKLAKEMGIKNYKGTDTQNIKMLNTLRNGSKDTPAASVPTKAAPTNVTAPASAVSGVDQSLIDKINSTFNASNDVTAAQNEAQDAKDKLNQLASKDIISADTWNAVNTPFTASSAYQEAMKYTNSLLEQLSSGRTSYTDQIEELMSQIQNRDKFSYDAESDTLFQQALASAMGSGRQAMQDTMGQAAALTGGYGSTYATNAANQAYNAYIEDAYNNLPEYYQMALEAYQMEGNEMYNQLNMLNQADASEYQRMYDSWSANFANAQNMYSQEYGAWQDSVNNAYNSANLQMQEHSQLYEQAYNNYGILQDNANTRYNQEYQSWADAVNNAMNYANMQNTDYWNTKNFDESVRQYDTNFNESVRQYDTSLAQNQSQFEAEMGYKNNALAQSQSQWEKEYALQQDKWNTEKDAIINGGGDDEYDGLSNAEIDTLKDLYIKAGGGEAGDSIVDRHLALYGKNVDVESLFAELSNIEIPSIYDDWTIKKDTKNWLGGKDNNDTYTNGTETKTYKQLAKDIRNSDLSDDEKDKLLDKLKKQNKK